MTINIAYVQEGPSNTWLGLEILDLNAEFGNNNKGSDNFLLTAVSLSVNVILVALSVETVLQSCAVAVAIFSM